MTVVVPVLLKLVSENLMGTLDSFLEIVNYFVQKLEMSNKITVGVWCCSHLLGCGCENCWNWVEHSFGYNFITIYKINKKEILLLRYLQFETKTGNPLAKFIIFWVKVKLKL